MSVQTALRVRTKALQCGISALNIMTLRGCRSSYREGLFLVCSHMKCHLEFDKIWRSNPLWELHWTAHFLILFSCSNQALTADPCHCVIKLIICHKNYCGLCCLEVRITGSLLILLNWLYCVSGQQSAHCCNRVDITQPSRCPACFFFFFQSALHSHCKISRQTNFVYLFPPFCCVYYCLLGTKN